MKIVTVNVPESYIEAIEKLIGENGLYPSRSELIRAATREYLIKELKMIKHMKKPSTDQGQKEEEEDKNMIKIPIEHLDENDEPVREFKTYRIIRKLEY